MVYLIAFELSPSDVIEKNDRVGKLFKDMGTYCEKCFPINDQAFLVRSTAKSAKELWDLFDTLVNPIGDSLIISRVTKDLIFDTSLEIVDNVQEEILFELFPTPKPISGK